MGDRYVLIDTGVDILDGTPLLDIKPYVVRFDCIETLRNGWHDEVDDETANSGGNAAIAADHDNPFARWMI